MREVFVAMREINPAAFDMAFTLETERARVAASLTRIYRAAGFSAVMVASQGALQTVAEQVRREGGELDGWVG